MGIGSEVQGCTGKDKFGNDQGSKKGTPDLEWNSSVREKLASKRLKHSKALCVPVPDLRLWGSTCHSDGTQVLITVHDGSPVHLAGDAVSNVKTRLVLVIPKKRNPVVCGHNPKTTRLRSYPRRRRGASQPTW